jgi:flagellar biosynthesis protein FlhF
MKSEIASMRIKSYFAGSVERAIHDAREELGDEATLITSRRSAPDARHLGAYEVVFGLAEAPESAQPAVSSEGLTTELTILRDQLDGIKRLLKLRGTGGEGFARPELGQLYQQLVSAGWEDALSRQITDEAYTRWQAQPPAQRSSSGDSTFEALAAECIGKRLRFAPEFTLAGSDQSRVVILVGPPGGGKTTTLAKIAIQECLAKRVSVRLISVDPHGVAAHEKLRNFAAIMGAGFTAASSAAQFMEAIDEFRNKHVLLIDTPGYGPLDWDWARDLASILAQLKQKEIHLVLPASMHLAGLLRYVRRYEEFNPDYLLFTKLDETESYGSMLSAAFQTSRPLSFLTRGQGIPEDIEAANSGALQTGLFVRERAEAISAA